MFKPRVVALAFAVGLLALAGSATAALLGLPADGSQVNSDPANGIDPNQSAGVSDIVGGSLAGGPRVPWAAFEQKSDSAQLIFVRAFKGGQWVTQGASLNIDKTVEAEAPSIDFAGAGRTVPWSAWYEPSSVFGGVKQIFASRFNATTNAWIAEGQNRGSAIPSLNIHTDKEAENPSVAGGATVAGNAPVPWVIWQEEDGNVSGSGNHDQIFVSKGVKQATCTGFKPSDANSVSAFCWQQVGAERLAENGGSSSTGDPTLNVDPSRDGVEPDVAFTGAGDTVAWAVWYEKGSSALGLRTNEQVFAAKLVADASADGGFHWQAVGSGTAGQTNPLDTSSSGFGPCAGSTGAEDACSLNASPTHDAEDARVAAGTPTPGTLTGAPTVPWVTWSEDTGSGKHAIFVSRLVGKDHFELFNGGAPVSNPHQDATTPDITFFGSTPYVSWVERRGANLRGFIGHFDGSVFVLDTPGGVRLVRGGAAALIDFRLPISSSCTADPFTADGSSCTPAAVNAPFFLFTTAGSPQRLFGQAVLGGPNCVLVAGCRVTVSPPDGVAVIQGTLGQSNTVGILVQRIVGAKRVHGERVLVLRNVGRVPLGPHHKGKLKIRWNLKVNGRRLKPGRYLITLRVFDSRRNLLGVANGVIITVKH